MVYTRTKAVWKPDSEDTAPIDPLMTGRCVDGRWADQSTSGHIRRASRTIPRPCASDAFRAAADGVRASVSRCARGTSSAPSATAAATDAAGNVNALAYEAQRLILRHQGIGGIDAPGLAGALRDSPGLAKFGVHAMAHSIAERLSSQAERDRMTGMAGYLTIRYDSRDKPEPEEIREDFWREGLLD